MGSSNQDVSHSLTCKPCRHANGYTWFGNEKQFPTEKFIDSIDSNSQCSNEPLLITFWFIYWDTRATEVPHICLCLLWGDGQHWQWVSVTHCRTGCGPCLLCSAADCEGHCSFGCTPCCQSYRLQQNSHTRIPQCLPLSWWGRAAEQKKHWLVLASNVWD